MFAIFILVEGDVLMNFKNYLISNADDLLDAVSAITECLGNDGINIDMKMQRYTA